MSNMTDAAIVTRYAYSSGSFNAPCFRVAQSQVFYVFFFLLLFVFNRFSIFFYHAIVRLFSTYEFDCFFWYLVHDLLIFIFCLALNLPIPETLNSYKIKYITNPSACFGCRQKVSRMKSVSKPFLNLKSYRVYQAVSCKYKIVFKTIVWHSY